jgi:hypothetical protein
MPNARKSDTDPRSALYAILAIIHPSPTLAGITSTSFPE